MRTYEVAQKKHDTCTTYTVPTKKHWNCPTLIILYKNNFIDNRSLNLVCFLSFAKSQKTLIWHPMMNYLLWGTNETNITMQTFSPFLSLRIAQVPSYFASFTDYKQNNRVRTIKLVNEYLIKQIQMYSMLLLFSTLRPEKNTHKQTDTHTHTHVCACTHTHTHTHTHWNVQKKTLWKIWWKKTAYFLKIIKYTL